MRMTVVAEYRDKPAEGINVVSKTLIDGLRARGHEVAVIPPASVLSRLPRLLLKPAPVTIFTHGPGPRTVLVSRILRSLSRTRILWVATRPDLGACPRWLRGGRSAHAILCNRPRADLAGVARDAHLVTQPIGIAPERLAGGGQAPIWAGRRRDGVPIAVHVGHLRRSRGLDRLCEIKALIGDRINIVVVASPYFDPDPGLMEELLAAGVHVDRGFVPAIADVYRAADLYLFTPPPEIEGAIELPLGVLEAIACGLPVISTPFGALPEALAGTDGVEFAPSEDFAQAVVRWVDRRAANPRPAGLPDHLNAHRITERVLELATGAE
jgi:glycosyltransferase involved in cell wall biosynthesis